MNASARLACCGAVASMVVGSARQAEAHPQLSTGLTIGAAGKGDRSHLWSSTKLLLGVRGELLLARESDAGFGVGPYVEALTTTGFSDFQAGAGATLLVPVHAYLPLLVSTGGYVGYRGPWGWEPGLAGELFWGSHSFNYHSLYALSAGVYAGGRYALGASRDVTILAGLRIDLELVALPFLLVWGAIKGGNSSR